MKKHLLFSFTIFSLLFQSCNEKKQANETTNNLTSEKNTELTIFIGADTQICDYAMYKAICMPVKFKNQNSENQNFLQVENGIEGFTPQKATEYELLVTKEKLSDPPSDAASVTYKLVKILSQKKVEMDDIIHNIEIDEQNGNFLTMSFNNTRGIVEIDFEGELIELKDNQAESGMWYKNEHYDLKGKTEDLELRKDGKTVFKSSSVNY